jgi:hypothetical protein
LQLQFKIGRSAELAAVAGKHGVAADPSTATVTVTVTVTVNFNWQL